MPLRWNIDRTSKHSYNRDLLCEWRQTIDARIETDVNNNNVTPEHLGKYLCQLPAIAKDLYGDQKVCCWEQKLRVILAGVRDSASPLSTLRGFEDTIIRNIYTYISHDYAKNVTLTLPAHYIGNTHIGRISRYTYGREHPRCFDRDFLHDLPRTSRFIPSGDGQPKQGFVAFSACGSIMFPEPADRNVNMLPFIFGDKSSLPANVQCYYDCIETCPYPEDYIGKVGYLTVHESYVEAGVTQRRKGLHIEAPGSSQEAAFTPGLEHAWGMGIFYGPDMYEGGIYVASNLSNTSEVWDALVHKDTPGIVDKHGGCEHLRPLIGPGTKLQANQLIWMTDCTPHEALPQETSCVRQFFRLVMPNISHWFAAHSTPNPLVPLPDHIIVVESNKFA
uniref:Uncharacterized protein n=1 Tax=Ditylum brightwellii TaxID=49249 RepID=A0A7S1Z5R4_9STRA|mmetsp:Transcript_24964/g.37247  ORF Transcript_24964/g.37247 Transcript_24964/m.37247 type:complete len:390 (+) Transcript_24964:22-1191(+)